MKTAEPLAAEDTIRFTAPLGDVVPLPKSALSALPTEGPAIVEGTINGFPFRVPLEPDRGLKISQALQDAAGAKPGQDVPVELTRFNDEPEVRVPADVEAAFKASEVWDLFADVTPMARREWVRWFISGKLEETRVKRIEVGIDKLSKGMRRPCCFPGLNFVTKGLVEPEETWAPLPGAKKGE